MILENISNNNTWKYLRRWYLKIFETQCLRAIYSRSFHCSLETSFVLQSIQMSHIETSGCIVVGMSKTIIWDILHSKRILLNIYTWKQTLKLCETKESEHDHALRDEGMSCIAWFPEFSLFLPILWPMRQDWLRSAQRNRLYWANVSNFPIEKGGSPMFLECS